MRKQSPNHHPWWEQAALDEAWKGTHKHTQMCSASLTIAYRGLPALNDCGTTRQTSDVFDRYIKHFQCWKMFIGCIARGRLTPCNATFLSIVILRVNVCNFVHSAKRRGMHLPVNPNLSSFFFYMLSSYLAKLPAIGEPMLWEVCTQSHARLAVGGHQQMPPNCRLAACFHVYVHTQIFTCMHTIWDTPSISLSLCLVCFTLFLLEWKADEAQTNSLHGFMCWTGWGNLGPLGQSP